MSDIMCATGFYGDDEIDELIKESLQMKQMNHPNVMGLLGVCLDAGPAPYIVLPFMSNGSLLSYLKNHRKTLLLTSEADEEQVRGAHFLQLQQY